MFSDCASIIFQGVPKEDVKIQLHGHALTISGDKKVAFDEKDPKVKFSRVESLHGTFARTIQVVHFSNKTFISLNYFMRLLFI